MFALKFKAQLPLEEDFSEATGQSTASATPGAEGERKWTIFGRNGDGRSSRKKTDTPIYIYT